MKHLMTVVGVLFAIVSTQQVGAEIRAFKLPDGRSLKAEIKSYNTSQGLVELKREDGKCVKVKPTIFVDADQKYIQDWAAMEGFRNPSFFKISCSKDTVKRWKKTLEGTVSYATGGSEKESIGQVKFEQISYELFLENRNPIPLENIEIEYCIFCKETGKGAWIDNPKWFKKITKGNLTIEALPSKSKKTLMTSSVITAVQEVSGDLSSARDDSGFEKIEVELNGVGVRITIKTPGGQTAVRTIYKPKDLEGKCGWSK